MTIKSPQEFLGLIGYYVKFVKDYGVITGPLIAMLCKNAFVWAPEASAALEQLKGFYDLDPGACLS